MVFVAKKTSLPVVSCSYSRLLEGSIYRWSVLILRFRVDMTAGEKRRAKNGKSIVIQLCDFLRALPPLHPGKVHGARD